MLINGREYVTYKEVRRRFGFSSTFLRNCRRRGWDGFIKIGRWYLYDASRLKELIPSRRGPRVIRGLKSAVKFIGVPTVHEGAIGGDVFVVLPGGRRFALDKYDDLLNFALGFSWGEGADVQGRKQLATALLGYALDRKVGPWFRELVERYEREVVRLLPPRWELSVRGVALWVSQHRDIAEKETKDE